MKPPSSLTHEQFNLAAKTFARLNRTAYELYHDPRSSIVSGWRWVEHPLMPRMGYLERLRECNEFEVEDPPDWHNHIDDEDGFSGQPEVQDEAEAATAPNPRLIMHQYVAWSPTYYVPVFCFTINDSSGTPVSLDRIYNSPFLKKARSIGIWAPSPSTPALFAPPSPKPPEEDINERSVPFPLLSHGDHPVLGTTCWIFHPCESANAVSEILNEIFEGEWKGSEEDLNRWLVTWFMILSSVVDLRV